MKQEYKTIKTTTQCTLQTLVTTRELFTTTLTRDHNDSKHQQLSPVTSVSYALISHGLISHGLTTSTLSRDLQDEEEHLTMRKQIKHNTSNITRLTMKNILLKQAHCTMNIIP